MSNTNNQTECPICFAAITEDTGRTVLSCKHEFHLKCVVTWLQTGGSCPCCRRSPGEMEAIGSVSSSDDDSILSDIEHDFHVTALMKAARDNDVSEIRRLIQEGADIEALDSDEDTPLMYAVLNQQMEAADLLLELGANVDILAKIAEPMLSLSECSVDLAILGACFYGCLPAVRACLDRGANPNTTLPGVGTTPLMEVIRTDQKEHVPAIVRLLLDRGASVSVIDGSGGTVFDWVVYEGMCDSEVLNILNAGKQITAIRRIQRSWRRHQMVLYAKTLASLQFTVVQEPVEEPGWFMSRMMTVQ